MTIFIRKYRQGLARKSNGVAAAAPASPARSEVRTLDVDFAPGDPFLAYLVSAPGLVELDQVKIDSPTLQSLRSAGVKVTVPLVSQGELIGLLNLGPRLSEQEYSSYDHQLLSSLATQAAPALRVAQLARQQQVEARERERIEQELHVARVIQQTLLPKAAPVMAGWQLAAYWQPARAVSGDFYDFIVFPDGRLAIVVADVSGKGVPAALLMATTRSLLRNASSQFVSPGEALRQTNELLCPDIPPNMFVTCLYALLDPASGRLQYANAGHNLPCKSTSGGVVELRATGMPLGLMPGMVYEEKQDTIDCGESLLIYSDGLVEAHNPQDEMFGFPRLRALAAAAPAGEAVIQYLLGELAEFTGPGWEQEDDVTFVTLQRNIPE